MAQTRLAMWLHLKVYLLVLACLLSTTVHAQTSSNKESPKILPFANKENSHPVIAPQLPALRGAQEHLLEASSLVVRAELVWLGPPDFVPPQKSDYVPSTQLVLVRTLEQFKGSHVSIIPVQVRLIGSNLVSDSGMLSQKLFTPGRQFLLFLLEQRSRRLHERPPEATTECDECQWLLFSGWLRDHDGSLLRYGPLSNTTGVYRVSKDETAVLQRLVSTIKPQAVR